MSDINFNGQIIPSGASLFGEENRAFRYGDALFESLRVIAGEIPFWQYHVNRLEEGMAMLQMVYPKDLDASILYDEIIRLTGKKGNNRIRLTIFRKNGGLYTPDNKDVGFLVSSHPLETDFPFAHKKGISIGISKQKLLAATPISHLKTSNALPYILGGIERSNRNYDDLLLLNQNGEIAEAVSSNIFVEKDNNIFTPPLSSGCVAGITRKWLMEQEKLDIQEKIITKDLLQKVDAIFLTNAVQGIRWVEDLNERKLKKPSICQLQLHIP